MQQIPLAAVKAGMVLAKDVLRANAQPGPPICMKGTVLSAGLIERLSRLDIVSVAVEGGEAEPTPEEQLAALDRRFSRIGDDPLMIRIHNLMRDRLVKRSGEAASQ
jgi:hypothetical protein